MTGKYWQYVNKKYFHTPGEYLERFATFISGQSRISQIRIPNLMEKGMQGPSLHPPLFVVPSYFSLTSLLFLSYFLS